jgi:hypothetical protein
MDLDAIYYQYRFTSDELEHQVRRLATTYDAIHSEEYKGIMEHLETEIERLRYLYRGREWPQSEE